MVRRILVRLGNGLVALAVAAAAVYAHTYVMEKDALDAPLTTKVAAGALAETGRFSARIDKVVAARSLRLLTKQTDPETGHATIKESTTVGTRDVFVVVTVSATSAGDPLRLGDAWLRTRDELEYAATDRLGETFTMADRPVQYGWPVDLTYVFEVPPGALPGASVVITAPSTNGIYDSIYRQRYDQLLPEAALTLTPDDAATKRLLDEVKTSWDLVAEG
jgi:hypothetical protein